MSNDQSDPSLQPDRVVDENDAVVITDGDLLFGTYSALPNEVAYWYMREFDNLTVG